MTALWLRVELHVAADADLSRPADEIVSHRN
jgi:hypothetical protein